MNVPQHQTSEDGVYPMRLVSVPEKGVRVLHMQVIKISRPHTRARAVRVEVFVQCGVPPSLIVLQNLTLKVYAVAVEDAAEVPLAAPLPP